MSLTNFLHVLYGAVGFITWKIRSEINPLSASVALIEKPDNWFGVQINWLVSI